MTPLFFRLFLTKIVYSTIKKILSTYRFININSAPSPCQILYKVNLFLFVFFTALTRYPFFPVQPKFSAFSVFLFFQRKQMKVDPLERSKWSAIVGWQDVRGVRVQKRGMDGDKEQQQQDRTVKVQRKRKRAHETKKKCIKKGSKCTQNVDVSHTNNTSRVRWINGREDTRLIYTYIL